MRAALFSLLTLAHSDSRKVSQGTGADYSPGYAFGFFASESISRGEDVLVVKRENVMGAKTSFELSAQLFCHNAIGTHSPWHQFIRTTLGAPGHSLYETLPSMPDAPQLALAKRSWARAAESCASIFAAEDDDETALQRAWATYWATEDSPGRLTLELWLWAEHQVRSRAFGDSISTLLPAEGTIFNHADVPTVGRYEDETGAMIFRSVRAIDFGQELLISYGEHTPLEWLRAYEFLPSSHLECQEARGESQAADGEAQGAAGEVSPCPADVAALLAACESKGRALSCMHSYAMKHDHTAHYNLGVVLEREAAAASEKAEHDAGVAAAVEQYRRAAELAPAWTEAHFNLATAYGVLGRLDESVDAARTAISLSPGHASAYQTLGTSLYTQGHLEESTAAYRAALAIDASDEGTLRNLALNLLQVNPHDAEAQQILGRLNRHGTSDLGRVAIGLFLACALDTMVAGLLSRISWARERSTLMLCARVLAVVAAALAAAVWFAQQ